VVIECGAVDLASFADFRYTDLVDRRTLHERKHGLFDDRRSSLRACPEDSSARAASFLNKQPKAKMLFTLHFMLDCWLNQALFDSTIIADFTK